MSQQSRKSCLSPDRCPNYDTRVNRCAQGYTDPKRIGEGASAAKMGLLMPCPYTERGQKVIAKLNKGE